ncbi:helix-turn-helix domain-containing protein [Anabaena azotica]|uniref:Helix-turn-helix domain-containing protein n=1 Tax=Anabaena azotica FACHB-119 TaxID=947527 RepID=A0ABR8D8B6_9NOST|nr:helix-turn-helix domain-containing protein [Anabaena azotica FACHB-119]
MTQRLPKRIRCQSDKLNKIENNGSTYISLAEAIKHLFLHESTIRYHIIRRRIRAFKSGGRWYLNLSDVEAFKKLYKIE